MNLSSIGQAERENSKLVSFSKYELFVQNMDLNVEYVEPDTDEAFEVLLILDVWILK